MWIYELIVKWLEEVEWSKWFLFIKLNKFYIVNKMVFKVIKVVERKERMSCFYF